VRCLRAVARRSEVQPSRERADGFWWLHRLQLHLVHERLRQQRGRLRWRWRWGRRMRWRGVWRLMDSSTWLPPSVGLGWRRDIAGVFDELPGIRFCEVIAESLPDHGPLPDPLTELIDRGVTVVPHGVRLS